MVASTNKGVPMNALPNHTSNVLVENCSSAKIWGIFGSSGNKAIPPDMLPPDMLTLQTCK
jgi:hypothetical protein